MEPGAAPFPASTLELHVYYTPSQRKAAIAKAVTALRRAERARGKATAALNTAHTAVNDAERAIAVAKLLPLRPDPKAPPADPFGDPGIPTPQQAQALRDVFVPPTPSESPADESRLGDAAEHALAGCIDCDRDTHRCRGCGAPVPHGPNDCGEHEIAGDGTGEALPPVSTEPRCTRTPECAMAPHPVEEHLRPESFFYDHELAEELAPAPASAAVAASVGAAQEAQRKLAAAQERALVGLAPEKAARVRAALAAASPVLEETVFIPVPNGTDPFGDPTPESS